MTRAVFSTPQNNLLVVHHNIFRKYKENIITSIVNSAKQLKYSRRGTSAWFLYSRCMLFPSEKQISSWQRQTDYFECTVLI